jgi:hypothetical protein
MAMSASEIAAERRRGRLAGVAAIAAGLLFSIGLLWSQFVINDRPENNAPAQLRFFDRHAGELLSASAIRSLGLLLLVFVALHLYKATKARNPQQNPVVAVIGVFGPLAAAIGTFAHDVSLAFAAADFTDRDFQTIDGAKDLTGSALLDVTVGLGIAGTVALAFWFVTGSLNAMRVGLLSRFMGVLGVIIGPAFLFNLVPPVTAFWLIALGTLFLGRWPRGLPPAWERGEAIPWPSMAGPDAQPVGEDESGSRNGEVDPVGPGVRKPQPEQEAASDTRARRKRRRRR